MSMILPFPLNIMQATAALMLLVVKILAVKREGK
jgi:hypothetical protein